MKYTLTSHARRRMEDRSISKSLVDSALANPTKVGYDTRGRILIKKLYKRGGAHRLLLIVAETRSDSLKIITVIETSKLKKYL